MANGTNLRHGLTRMDARILGPGILAVQPEKCEALQARAFAHMNPPNEKRPPKGPLLNPGWGLELLDVGRLGALGSRRS